MITCLFARVIILAQVILFVPHLVQTTFIDRVLARFDLVHKRSISPSHKSVLFR